MVRWILLVCLIGVTGVRLYLYSPKVNSFTEGEKISILTTVLDTNMNQVSGIYVNIPKNLTMTIGDRLEIVGTLAIQVSDEKRKILSLIEADYKLIGSEKSLRVLIARLRFIVTSKLLEWLPGDTGALAAGILVGGDEYMSEVGVSSFKRAGLTHIVAASGYNVGIVATWTAGILGKWMNKFIVMYFGILSIVLYIFLAGGSAAVVRAGIMAIVVIVGKMFGRESDGGWLLILSCLLMLIFNPGWWFDIGFQLSVAAMVGMVYLAGRSVVSQTLACQLTTLPIILHYFGNLSVVAPIANLLFLWPVPVIMPVLAVAVLVGMVIPAGGMLVSFMTFPLLKYMVEGAYFISSAHWSAVEIGNMSWTWVVVYYLVLIILKFKIFNKDFDRQN